MILGNIVFFTPERMSELWDMVGKLLSMASPMVMLAAAIVAVGLLIGVVIHSFRQAAVTKKEDDDDDNGYEVRRY